jgi:hypothetical protein
MRILGRAIAVIALLSTSSAAYAAKGDFPLCDGFPAPNKKVDNMLKETSLWGLASGSAGGRKADTGIGEQGIRACDASLSDPLLLPTYWQRRAHLLLSKSLHLIATEKYEDALATLTESEKLAAANEDTVFEDSAMLGAKMLRAVALGRSGKKDEARQILADLRKMRPYASTITRSIERLENSFDNDIGKMITGSKKLMPLEPQAIRQAFMFHMFKGEIAQAAEYEDDLSLTPPKSIGGWSVDGDNTSGYTDEYETAELDATRAYVMAGIGQAEKAKAMHDTIRTSIAELRIPPPPPEKGKKQRKSILRDFEARTLAATRIENMQESWEKAAEIRKTVSAAPTSIEAIKDDFTKYRVFRTAAQYDIMRLLKPSKPEEKETLAKSLEALDSGISKEVFGLSGSDLFKMLPRPETLKLVPKFTQAGIWFGSAIGASQAKEKDGVAQTIRFGAGTGSPALVEELSMLAVADYAKKEGADSFIILSRRTIIRTTYIYGAYAYGGAGGVPSGYESQLRVMFLNRASLPANLESKRWRLIKVDDVYKSLQPKFDAIELQKLALKK